VLCRDGGGGGGSVEHVGNEAPGTRATGGGGDGTSLSSNGVRSGGVEHILCKGRGYRRNEVVVAGCR
jgi:hypothetical protein